MLSPLFAQLPNGSVAPDWTASDIDGVEHNLYSYLDSGYAVILDFSATWCGPCWNYHNSGVLEEVHETHGPDGTNTVRVFMIESDDNTTDEDLHGTGSNTWGDWTAGTEYPIIDNGAGIFNAFDCAYYPTIFTICPNRLATEVGQAGFEQHVNFFQSMDCAPASLPFDAGIIAYTGGVRSCPNTPTPLSIRVINNGTDPLTACAFEATTLFGAELLTYEWSGNLETYEIADIELGEAIFPSTGMFFIDVASIDDFEGNNSVSATMNLSTETATSLVRVSFTTDQSPGDNRWAIFNSNGEEVAGIGFGEMDGANTEYTWWINLEATGCYQFDVFDIAGNGGNVACSIDTFDEALNNINNIYTLNNSGVWSNVNKGFLVNEINTGVGESLDQEALFIAPNPNRGSVQLQGLSRDMESITIHDLKGALRRDIPIAQMTGSVLTLDVTDLEAGIYVLTVRGLRESQSIQMICH